MTTTTTDRRLVTLVLLALAALLLLPFGLMGFGMMGSGPMMGGTWGGMWTDAAVPGWYSFVAFAVPLLVLVALAGSAYLAFRLADVSTDDADDALDTLRTAYARGDLTDEEYEHRREVLERDG